MICRKTLSLRKTTFLLMVVAVSAFKTTPAQADFNLILPSKKEGTKEGMPQKREKKNTTKKTNLLPQIRTKIDKNKVRFTAGEATVLQKQNTIILKKNVIFEKADINIKSQKTTLFFSQKSASTTEIKSAFDTNPNTPLGSGHLKKALAQGNVKIIKKVEQAPDIRLESEEALYDVPKHTVTLTGKAKAWKGENFIHAYKIEIDVLTDHIRVIQAKGIISPEGQM